MEMNTRLTLLTSLIMLLRSSTQSTDGKFGKALTVNNQNGASWQTL